MKESRVLQNSVSLRCPTLEVDVQVPEWTVTRAWIKWKEQSDAIWNCYALGRMNKLHIEWETTKMLVKQKNGNKELCKDLKVLRYQMFFKLCPEFLDSRWRPDHAVMNNRTILNISWVWISQDLYSLKAFGGKYCLIPPRDVNLEPLPDWCDRFQLAHRRV